jgi:hypothetical protein
MAPKGVPQDQVMTPEFRVAFPFLFTPRPAQAADKKASYEVTMLFPQTADLSGLKKAAHDCMVNKFGPDKAKWPRGFKSPFRSGDEKAEYQGFAGATFVAARSTRQPGIVDQKVQAIVDPNRIYPGCWCRAVVKASWYDFNGNKGIKFFLNHIQLLRDDEPLVAKTRPEDVFQQVAGGPNEADSFGASDGDEPDF